MLKSFYRLKFSLVILFIISCGQAPETESGFIDGDTYHNNMLKISLTFPEGWSIIKDEETFRLLGNSDPSEPKLKEKWRKAKAKPLVTAYRFSDKDFEINKNVLINPNITAIIEYIPEHVNIKNAYQYIPSFKQALAKHPNVTYEFEANQTVTINGFQFDLVAFKFNQFGKIIKKRTYLHKYGDYILNITIVWSNDDEQSLRLLMKSLLSLRLDSEV